MLSNPKRYLDRVNFATNYAFFRDQGGLHTRLVTANYWAGYGAGPVRLWLRLFDGAGAVLAEWEHAVPPGAGGIAIDSAEIRARFGLPEFAGQLFIHAIGAAGHDVVKYALDTYGSGNQASLSCTHDANAWPADRYAGMPAPRPDERVVLWLQNSHAAPIPAGAVLLDRMGAENAGAACRRRSARMPAWRSTSPTCCRALHWPAQIEVRAGRHVVRPRYEVTRAGRTRIAHLNVERADLRPDPGIPSLHNLLGRGYLLPFPILPRDTLPQHRAADPDGRTAGDPAASHRRVRPRRTPGRRAASSAACRATMPWRSTSPSSTSRRATPTWSMTSATAARPMAGCTPWCATSTGPAAMPPRAASARISTTPR